MDCPGNLDSLQLKKWQEKQAFMCIRENALNRVTELCFPNSYTLEEVYRELYLIIGHLYEELQALYDNVTSRAINRIFDYSSNMFMGLCESFAIEALTEPEIDINANNNRTDADET
ncbi:hypothetical protein ACFFRR_011395 [Megaselia abdita]